MSEFKAPPVFQGQTVLWRNDPSSETYPAIVTRVHTRNLLLHIFSPHSATPLLREGVYHISDPQAMRQGNKDAGVWDYCQPHCWAEEPTGKPDLAPLHGLKGGKK